MSSLSPARSFIVKASARALALVTFLFLLNAFIQSGSIQVAEGVIGLCWLAGCYWLSGGVSVPTVLGLTFAAGVGWGLGIASQPVSAWVIFHQWAEAFS